MTVRALIIDDDAAIRETVCDIVTSLGHEYETATCQIEARELIEAETFDYVLLDLEIPVRSGRAVPRVQNGLNTLDELVERYRRRVPVIVMTGHGTDGPDLAVDVLTGGAVNFVTKPFPLTGEKSLDRAILSAVGTKPRPEKRTRNVSQQPQPFQGGEVVVYFDRVIINNSDVPIGDVMHDIIIELAHPGNRNTTGEYRGIQGSELAARIDCLSGEGGIRNALCKFRKVVRERLRDDHGILLEQQDVICSGAQGYRLNNWIEVEIATPVEESRPKEECPAPASLAARPQAEVRRAFILHQAHESHEIRASVVVERFGCNMKTAQRDLQKLKKEGELEFVGPPKTGFYRRAS